MGQVTKPITKAERRKALKRVIAFRKEFASKPEHAIDLNKWHYTEDPWHCGTIGCVGGYADYSPLMRAYRGTLYVRTTPGDVKPLFSFFGVTQKQAEQKDLFTARLWNPDQGSDKAEGLARLDRLIKWHKKLLEA